jgi:PAS domain-containing protein
MNDELQRRTSELQTLTQSFDDLMRTVDVGLFALGPDRRVKHSNRLGQEMVGIAKGGGEATFDTVRLHWDLKDVGSVLDRVESEEKQVRVERVAARRGRLLDVSFAPLRDPKDVFAGYLITLIDQTSAHEALRRANRGLTELQASIDACADPHISLDGSLTIVHANEAARKAFGFKVDPVGLPLEDLVKRRAGVLQSAIELSSISRVRANVSKGEIHREEVRLDGPEPRNVEAVFTPAPDSSGKDERVRAVLVLHDSRPSEKKGSNARRPS